MSHLDGASRNIPQKFLLGCCYSSKQHTFLQTFFSVPVDTVCRCFCFFAPKFWIESVRTTLCYIIPATRDTLSGLIHFGLITSLVRWLSDRLLIRDWVDLIDGDSSFQFESGWLGW